MSGNPLTILWIGKCTIYEYREIKDEDTYETTHDLVPVVIDEPCRLSQANTYSDKSDTTKNDYGIPFISNVIKLFIRPDLIIKSGSVIEVTQHGRTEKYKRSGEPAVYSNHQEITLELYEDNA